MDDGDRQMNRNMIISAVFKKIESVYPDGCKISEVEHLIGVTKKIEVDGFCLSIFRWRTPYDLVKISLDDEELFILSEDEFRRLMTKEFVEQPLIKRAMERIRSWTKTKY